MHCSNPDLVVLQIVFLCNKNGWGGRTRSFTTEPCFFSFVENKNGWGGRTRTHECRDQNPMPYHLATPQCETIIPQVYSLRNASTGSFFDADLAGIKPPSRVNIIERQIKKSAILMSKVAESGMSPVK